MNDEQAEMFYAGAGRSPDPRPPVQTDDERRAEAMFGRPAEPEQRTPAQSDDPADKLYGNRDPMLYFGDQARTIEQHLLEDATDPDEARATAASWAETFQAYGVTPSEAGALINVVRGGLSADAAARAGWAAEARAGLAAEFGPEKASAALTAAQALVQSDPELRGFLLETGLGDHPAIVQHVARIAMRRR